MRQVWLASARRFRRRSTSTTTPRRDDTPRKTNNAFRVRNVAQKRVACANKKNKTYLYSRSAARSGMRWSERALSGVSTALSLMGDARVSDCPKSMFFFGPE